MKLTRYPTLIAHADWSKDANKRWVAIAEREPAGRITVRSVEPVGDLGSYFPRLLARAPRPAEVLAGFDFPIGLPLGYATRAGIEDFVTALPMLGNGPWAEFYTLARQPAEISLTRPFYPHSCARKGDAKQAPWCEALGAPDRSALLRACEQPTAQRQAASPLFWTIGGKQVGRAAISGWRDLLAPALTADGFGIRLWPFHGGLSELLSPDHVVVAETYPAEYYHHLGLNLGPVPGATKAGKRVQASRAANATRLFDWASHHSIALADSVADAVADGFGPAPDGEDRFDAFVGLLGMLEVIVGGEEPTVGLPAQAARVEGWILGQPAPG